jgi:hypothetical protein
MFLREGRLREGIEAYAKPADNAERFSLAVLEAVEGARQFGLGLAGLALNPDLRSGDLPFLRLAVPARASGVKEKATPERIAGLFKNFRAALERANAAVSAVDDKDFKVEVNFMKARMDLNGDGTVAADELVLESLGRPLGVSMSDLATSEIVVKFDRADAAWLKGYTHFLIGVMDLVSAYDWMPVWNQCAHFVFEDPEPPPPIAKVSAPGQARRDMARLADAIATLHEMRLEPVHPERVAGARGHFVAMIACSRDCWRRVLAETDDDAEWLPSPGQTGPGGARVTGGMVEGWERVLDELEAVLTGKRLLPHWRLKPDTGINVDKFVKAPPRLDPVLWFQGSALVPFVEEGPVSDAARWRDLMEPFGHDFALFALWSN